MKKKALLAGSAMGIVTPKEHLIKGNVQPGDAIVIVESTGIHANGLTMARRIAKKLRKGYRTKLEDGRTYGETLLDPTHIYVGLIEDCLNQGVDIHYVVNVTGHGWRKLMRLPDTLAYIIDTLPRQWPIFPFMQKYGPIDDREAYGNLNMGAGYALYVPESHVDEVIGIAALLRLRAYRAGYIEASKTKKVVIRPKDLEYLGDTLGVR